MGTPDELLAAADHALYRAKREGRDAVRLFGTAARDSVTDQAPMIEEKPLGVVERDEGPRAPEERSDSANEP